MDKPPSSVLAPNEILYTANLAQEDESPKYADGKQSIEHQLDIHIRDLVDSSDGDLVASTLEGLQYIYEYRIEGGRYPNMELDLMRRLALALLEHTGKREDGGFLFGQRRPLSECAVMAMRLFSEFVLSVKEFGEAVGQMEIGDLRRKLQLHAHLLSNDTTDGLKVLRSMTRYPQFGDWRELVKRERQSEVAELLLQHADLEEQTPISESKKYPPEALYFDRDASRVLHMFQTSLDSGLTSEQVREYSRHYGRNSIPSPPLRPWYLMLLDQLKDFMILLLLLAAITSPLIDPHDVISPCVLILVIVVNVLIGFIQEVRATRAMSALLSLQVPKARVLRDRCMSVVDSCELVPGDVVILEEGDAVPADIRLLVCNRLEMVESLLTGESEPVPKQASPIRIRSRRLAIQKCSGIAFMGTLVARGTGKGIVVRTSSKTEIGSISQSLAQDTGDTQSNLQKELHWLGIVLAGIAVFLCLVIVLIGVINKRPFLEMLHYGVNLAVSVIPEGLVAVVTVSQALAVGRMAKKQAIVRRLPAVETLGSVSVICTDKTGTLTEGRMKFCGFFVLELSSNKAWEVASICNNARVRRTLTDGNEILGSDTTEVALLEGFLAEGNSLLERERICEIPFDSDRKMMSVIYKHEGQYYMASKGAPEIILSKCRDFYTSSGVAEITSEDNQTVTLRQAEMSDRGWRVLGLALTKLPGPRVDCIGQEEMEQLEKDMTLVGLVGLADPPRPGIPSALQKCYNAGIEVVMITGDHPATACAIAKQIGFAHVSVMRGREVDILGSEGLQALQQFPTVFARVSPANKLAIVKALQALGHCTAMTGDGVNDAPAIRKADIGIAMGRAGTDLAKQAADIILTDDDFGRIVEAVEEGRLVYDNIGKFVVYLLACNSAEIWTVLAALVLKLPVPLTSVMILWANIIADIPPSLSLSCEGPEQDLLRRPPRRTKDKLLSLWNAIFIITLGLLISMQSLYEYVRVLSHHDVTEEALAYARSEAFLTLTVLQLALAFMCRSLTRSVFSSNPLSRNIWMVGAVCLSLGCCLAGHYIPGLNRVFGLRPVGLHGWLRIAISVVVLVLFSETLKLLRRLK